MVIELRGMSYDARLKALGLTTLEVRLKRGDLIQIYKIKNNVEEVYISMGANNLGGYSGRRYRHQITREVMGNVAMRNNFLPNRDATIWNLLPLDIVWAGNVTSFKTRIDKHISLETLRRSVYRV
jgi:hypothetical protein